MDKLQKEFDDIGVEIQNLLVSAIKDEKEKKKVDVNIKRQQFKLK